MAACAAGDRELYDEAMPMLEVMGKRSFFLGEVGQGAKMKLVINMVRQHGARAAMIPKYSG
jgi:3-hydroxyisobutyrate dehydrogenase-like beta-hydroxyacid dehydrogenase